MLTFCDGESRMTLGGGGGVKKIFAEIIGWLFACHVAIGLQCCHGLPSATFGAARTNSSMEFEGIFTVSSTCK